MRRGVGDGQQQVLGQEVALQGRGQRLRPVQNIVTRLQLGESHCKTKYHKRLESLQYKLKQDVHCKKWSGNIRIRSVHALGEKDADMLVEVEDLEKFTFMKEARYSFLNFLHILDKTENCWLIVLLVLVHYIINYKVIRNI